MNPVDRPFLIMADPPYNPDLARAKRELERRQRNADLLLAGAIVGSFILFLVGFWLLR